jgi:hypothetical protein
MHPLNDATDAQRLLTQAAERLSQITLLTEADEAGWFVEFDGGEGFFVEWSSEWSRLVLSAELGVPSAEGEIAALRLALSYNALWRDIGDLRIARDGDEGDMLLIGELGADDAEPETFQAALLHFENLRRWWTDAIAQGAAKGAAPSTDQALLLGRV